MTAPIFHNVPLTRVQLPETSQIPDEENPQLRPSVQTEIDDQFRRSNGAQSQLIQGISSPYGRGLHHRSEQFTHRGLRNRLRQYRRDIGNGERIAYYNAFHVIYSLLPQENDQQRRRFLREFTSLVEDYQNFLDHAGDLGDMQRLRYLYAASQVLHATITWLQESSATSHPNEVLNQEWTPLLQNLLQQVDTHLLYYFDNLFEQGHPELEQLTGLRGEIQLRQALIVGDIPRARELAHHVSEYYHNLQLGPAPADPTNETWYLRWARRFLNQEDFLARLAQVDSPSQTENHSLYFNALSSELLIDAAAGFDLVNEEELSVVQQRYQILGSLLTILSLQHPERNLSEQLQRLATEDSASLASEIQELISQHEAVANLLDELSQNTGSVTLQAILRQGRAASNHVLQLQSGPGSYILNQITENNQRHHPIASIARLLLANPAIQESMRLPADPTVASIELLRRRDSALQSLENLREINPALPIEDLVTQLNHTQNLSQILTPAIDQLIENFQLRLSHAPEHELPVLRALAERISQSSNNDNAPSLPHASVNRAQNLLNHMDSLGFRARQIGGHLVSPTGAATLLSGILFAEFAPSLLLGRLGQLRGLRGLAPAGVLGWRATLGNGFATGALMSAVGSYLQNRSRAAYGLNTHFGRDFAHGSLLNGLTFMGAMGAGRLLNNWVGTGLRNGQAIGHWWNRGRFLVHSGTFLAGSALALGLGTLAQGIQHGQWQLPSADQSVETLLTMLAFELGIGTLRQIRHRAALHHELRLPSKSIFGRANRSLGGLLVNRWVPVLGASRSTAVQIAAEQSVQRNVSLDGNRASILQRIGIEEMHNPGFTERFSDLIHQGHTPVLFGEGRPSQLLLLSPDALDPRMPSPTSRQDPTHPVRSDPVIFRIEPLLLPANTETSGELLPQHSGPLEYVLRPIGLEIQGEGIPGLVFSSPDGLAGKTPSLMRGDFSFLESNPNSPTITRVLSRRGNGTIEFDQHSVPSIKVREGQQDTTWIRIADEWVRLREGASPHRLLAGSELAFGRLYGHGERLINSENARYSIEQRMHERIPVHELRRYSSNEESSRAAEKDPHYFSDDAIFFQWDLLQPMPTELSPQRVALEAGGNTPLGELHLVRNRDSSEFRLAGSGRYQIQIQRQFANNGETFNHWASDNPVIGEIGETVTVRVLHGERAESYRLHLDDPQGSASQLPRIQLIQNGDTLEVPFRSTNAELSFGRISHPDFFTSTHISRNHFSLQIIEHQGQPRYQLTVHSQMGIQINNYFYAQGESTHLPSGEFEVHFPQTPMNLNPELRIGPLRLRLPPIETPSPDWGLRLRPKHDRGISFEAQIQQLQEEARQETRQEAGEERSSSHNQSRETLLERLRRMINIR